MAHRKTKRTPRGFTMIEMMVGMIIFIIGVVGFSGMTVMQATGNRIARGQDEAATILQSSIENLNNVVWSELGNDSSLPTTTGLTNDTIWQEGPLNRNGETLGTGTGPYTYYRSIVICSQASTAAVASTPSHCGSLNNTNRPTELACSTLGLTSREKMIRVLVSWSDRSGACRYKGTDALAFDW